MIGAVVRVVHNKLPRFNAKFRTNVASAMRDGMINFNIVVDPPVDTGFLTGNRTHVYPSASFFGSLKGQTTFNAPYAGYVHDGTRYMKARPYAQDAIDLIRDDYVEGIRQATEGALR